MDVSLYQMAFNIQPSLQPLEVSPATLKSIIKALIDVLIEQNIGGKILIKFPPGKIWTQEIDRYQKQVSAAHIIYICNSSELSKTASLSPSIPVNEQISQSVKLNLDKDHQFKREYFILVLSAKFCSFILVNYSRKIPVSKTVTDNLLSIAERHGNLEPKQKSSVALSTEIISIKSPQSPTFPKKALLQTIYTFNKQIVERIFQEIGQGLIQFSHQIESPQFSEQEILTHLLTKHIQQQEEITNNAQKEHTSESTIIASLKRQNQALINDLQFKDELLTHVAQELRTPLTNMKTALTLIETAHLKTDQRKRYLHLLKAECDRQNFLINGLLELVDIEHTSLTIAPHAVKLADVLPGLVSTYQAIALDKNIQLHYTMGVNLPAVSCVEMWLKQIVINLLNNSIKFTLPQGQIWVIVKQKDKNIQIEFKDTGIGIAPQEIPRIFDRFYHGKASMEDDVMPAGLGLTIVQQLLNRCGGAISVISKLGEGSIFKVLLPIVRD